MGRLISLHLAESWKHGASFTMQAPEANLQPSATCKYAVDRCRPALWRPLTSPIDGLCGQKYWSPHRGAKLTSSRYAPDRSMTSTARLSGAQTARSLGSIKGASKSSDKGSVRMIPDLSCTKARSQC